MPALQPCTARRPLCAQTVTAATERLEWRLVVLTGSLEGLLNHVFGLLQRLREARAVALFAAPTAA